MHVLPYGHFLLLCSNLLVSFYWRKRPCLTICSALNMIGLFTLTMLCGRCLLEVLAEGAGLTRTYGWLWADGVVSGIGMVTPLLVSWKVCFISWLEQVQSCALTDHLVHLSFNMYSQSTSSLMSSSVVPSVYSVSAGKASGMTLQVPALHCLHCVSVRAVCTLELQLVLASWLENMQCRHMIPKS